MARGQKSHGPPRDVDGVSSGFWCWNSRRLSCGDGRSLWLVTHKEQICERQ
jgi:hypothetical protein